LIAARIAGLILALFSNRLEDTIFDLTRRAADAVQVQLEYGAILMKIRGAPILYVDEISIHVQGERHWIWTFPTPLSLFS